MARTRNMQKLLQIAGDVREAEYRTVSFKQIDKERRMGMNRRERLTVSRRDFLKVGGAAVAGTALVGSTGVAFATTKVPPTIGIIGGGIAGMAAAYTLQKTGPLGCTVFEASNRIGGRMHSLMPSSGYWEATQFSEWCGQIVNKATHKTIVSLCKTFTIPLYSIAAPKGGQETNYIFTKYYTYEQARTDFSKFSSTLHSQWTKSGTPTYKSSNATAKKYDAMSANQWINTYVPGGLASNFGACLSAAYESETGLSCTVISALNIIEVLGTQPSTQPTGGFSWAGTETGTTAILAGNQRLPVAIYNYVTTHAPACNVYLQWKMTAIGVNPNGTVTCEFTTPTGTTERTFDEVILTLPFNVLRHLTYATARFTTLKKTIIKTHAMGTHTKMNVQFNSAYWNTTGPWPGISVMTITTTLPFQTTWWSGAGQAGPPSIATFFPGGPFGASTTLPGPYVTATSSAAAAAYVNTYLAQLNEILPGATTNYSGKATISTPWSDPNLNGSYSTYLIGQYTTQHQAESLRVNNIHFAGEATSNTFWGFMQGGATSGIKAAKQIITTDYKKTKGVPVAPVAEASSITLAFTSPTTYGAEGQTFSGKLTGTKTDGQPDSGTVTIKATGITLCSTSTLVATGADTVTYSCVLATGEVLAAGTYTTVTATYSGGTSTLYYTYKTSTSTKQTLVVQKATPVITWATPAAISFGTKLSTRQLDASASVAGTFTYTPATGTVLGAGSHTLKATFTPTTTTNYNSTSASRKLLVQKATPVITWAPAAIDYGTKLSTQQLDASASVAGTFTYTPATGTVLGAGSHTLKVTFTPTTTTNYTSTSATRKLVVTRATPVISWATPSAIGYGTALSTKQLDASASVAGTFTYTPATGTVLGAGTYTLEVTFTPTTTTNYTSVSATRTLVVQKATPVITWATPAPIGQGTALSTKQLDATASVAGTFTYTPSTGTVLGTGPHTLEVTFTPTTTTNYTSVSATRTLVVKASAPSAPGKPTATRGDEKAKVTWTAPATNGSPITKYTVTSNTGLHTATWTSGPLSITVKKLVNGNSYTFTVVAHNAAGASAKSAPSTPVTPAGVPSAPGQPSATPGKRKATVTWSASASTNGSPITSYTVKSTPGAKTATWTSGPLTVTVKKLTNGTSYTFTVKAHNAVGASAASAPSTPVTPGA